MVVVLVGQTSKWVGGWGALLSEGPVQVHATCLQQYPPVQVGSSYLAQLWYGAEGGFCWEAQHPSARCCWRPSEHRPFCVRPRPHGLAGCRPHKALLVLCHCRPRPQDGTALWGSSHTVIIDWKGSMQSRGHCFQMSPWQLPMGRGWAGTHTPSGPWQVMMLGSDDAVGSNFQDQIISCLHSITYSLYPFLDSIDKPKLPLNTWMFCFP